MQQEELIPHLFRTEYSKITAVLCKLFGIDHIEIAEDIASETFLFAVESWPYQGIPANPAAWLYVVAKNKAKNYFTRNRIFREKVADQLKTQAQQEIEIDLSEENIIDSQLQMLFAICHPSISTEAQISLSLRILCGFGIDEIAIAFLTNRETINKRLFRAKEKLRAEKLPIAFPEKLEIKNRLETVLRTIYLLFSEGYFSESQDAIIREDLCSEAIRLTYLLTKNVQTNQHSTNALLALMCFQASRLPARQDEDGQLVLYQDQDETKWNKELIERGNYYLIEAAKWEQLSKYYLEASIAYRHTIKADTHEKWENILQLYNHLLQLEYSPIAALNRTFALSKANGKEEAIGEALKLNLTGNHFYHLLLGELFSKIDNGKARAYFETAISMAKTAAEKVAIKKKVDKLGIN